MIFSMNMYSFAARRQEDAGECTMPTEQKETTSQSKSSEGSAQYSLTNLPRALAKLSIMLTAMATFRQVVVQPEAHSMFGLRSSTVTANSVQNGPALGSAAITSVTETFSPILPFTGGVDLRKEDSLTSFAKHLFGAFGPKKNNLERDSPRLESIVSGSKPQIHHTTSLSATECFCDLKDIAHLTLHDVATVFRYAMDINLPAFDPSRELKQQLPRVQKVLQSMNLAVEKSRGSGVSTSLQLVHKGRGMASSGSADALFFLAAMRVFAEWRLVRQVPAGYKGYEVGMNLGLKDVVQNVGKVEKAIHDWIDSSRPNHNGQLHSPTIGELMRSEFDSGIHPNLPRLQDRTAAMGLLWVRRQLQYQMAIFENILQDDKERFPTTTEVVKTAYEQVYNKYHGWAVQKIFTYSFQSAPESEVVFRHMNPLKLKELEGMQPPAELSSNQDASSRNSGGAPNESRKNKTLARIVGRFRKRHNHDNNDKGKDNISSSSSLKNVADWIDQEMTRDAHQNIAAFLETARPLLNDIAKAFDEFNMDDPTKV